MSTSRRTITRTVRVPTRRGSIPVRVRTTVTRTVRTRMLGGFSITNVNVVENPPAASH